METSAPAAPPSPVSRMQARLAMAIRVGRFGIWEYDIERAEFWLDERQCELFGLPAHTQLASLETWLRAVHVEDLENVRERFLRAASGQAPFECTYRIMGRDSQWGWVHSVAEVERRSDGRPVRLVGLDQDVSADQQIRARLESIVHRHDLAVRAAGGMVWEYDIRTGVVWRLPGALELRSGVLQEQRSTFEAMEPLIAPESRDDFRAYVQRLRQGEHTHVEQDLQVLHPSLGRRHIRSLAHVERDAQGRAQHAYGMNIDITDGVRARQALEDANQRLRIALSAVRASVWEYDAQSRRLHWDDRARELYGIDLNTHRQAWESVLSPHIATRTRQRIYASLKDPNCSEFDLTYTIEHPQRGRRHIRSVGLNQRDERGRLVRCVGLDMDVTEQAHTAERAQELSQRLQLAITAAGIGVWSYRLSDGAIEWNEQQYQIYGLEPRSTRISRSAWLERVHPDDRKRLADQVSRMQLPPNGSVSEFRIVRPSGEVRYLRAVAQSTRDEDGHLTGTVGLTFDITAEHEALQAIERSRAAAEEANRLKSEFLANMSHEIRTPMNAIIGMTELALDGALPPLERDQISKANAAARNLLAVLNDILDFAKIEAGKLDVEHMAFSLQALVGSSLDMVRLQAQTKGLALDVVLDPCVPDHFLGDPTRLRQVLSNLLSNAVKFTERGRVQLRICLMDGSSQNRPIVRFEIEDSGIGLSEEQQARLFEAFTQGDTSTTRRFGGTGLGLVISRRLLDLMGGRIGVRSTLGQGSLFWFQLPLELDTRAPSDTREAARAAAPRLDGLRVLLAEDNPLNRELAITLLERAGAQVTAVDNGAQAVAAVQRQAFDVVLMDVQMPEMDGYEATRRIRALGGTAGQLPIVAMTAHAMSGDRERSLAAGMNEHLSKPIHTLALRETLARLRPQTAPAVHSSVDPGHDPLTPDADLPLLDAQLGVRLCAQREDIYQRALQHFLQLYEARTCFPPDLSGPAVQHEAHSLKGAAASLGLVRLQHLAAHLEAQCKAGRLPEAAELHALNNTLQASCRAVAAFLAATGRSAAAPTPP
jgi:two-component system sensor histidine kinase/response regulator